MADGRIERRMHHAARIGLAMFALASAPLAAQTMPDQAERRDPVGDNASIDQISTGSRTIPHQPRRTVSPAPPSQISRTGDTAPAAQLTGERGTRPQRQLNSSGRTAAAPEALSRPADGRTGTVVRVEGQDRCDPAEADSNDRVCQRVIETRAAEFARPAQGVLSAEQRLLIDQQLREQPANSRTAVRRLGEAGGDPESIEEQGVASIALKPPNAPSRPDPSENPERPELDPAVQAILGIIGVQPPPPQ